MDEVRRPRPARAYWAHQGQRAGPGRASWRSRFVVWPPRSWLGCRWRPSRSGAQLPDGFEVALAVRAEGNQRPGVLHSGEAVQASCDDFCQLFEVPNAHDSYYVRLAGHRVRLRNALDRGDLLGKPRNARWRGIYQHEGRYHSAKASALGEYAVT